MSVSLLLLFYIFSQSFRHLSFIGRKDLYLFLFEWLSSKLTRGGRRRDRKKQHIWNGANKKKYATTCDSKMHQNELVHRTVVDFTVSKSCVSECEQTTHYQSSHMFHSETICFIFFFRKCNKSGEKINSKKHWWKMPNKCKIKFKKYTNYSFDSLKKKRQMWKRMWWWNKNKNVIYGICTYFFCLIGKLSHEKNASHGECTVRQGLIMMQRTRSICQNRNFAAPLRIESNRMIEARKTRRPDESQLIFHSAKFISLSHGVLELSTSRQRRIFCLKQKNIFIQKTASRTVNIFNEKERERSHIKPQLIETIIVCMIFMMKPNLYFMFMKIYFSSRLVRVEYTKEIRKNNIKK